MRPEKVPTVSLDIEEYSNPAVRLDARSRYERNASTDHPIVGGLEVINPQEHADPAGKLPANDLRLVVAISPRQQNTGHTAGGANDDPAFGATIVRQGWDVLNEFEPQHVHEEVDRWVVLPHNESHQLQVRHHVLPVSEVTPWESGLITFQPNLALRCSRADACRPSLGTGT